MELILTEDPFLKVTVNGKDFCFHTVFNNSDCISLKHIALCYRNSKLDTSKTILIEKSAFLDKSESSLTEITSTEFIRIFMNVETKGIEIIYRENPENEENHPLYITIPSYVFEDCILYEDNREFKLQNEEEN